MDLVAEGVLDALTQGCGDGGAVGLGCIEALESLLPLPAGCEDLTQQKGSLGVDGVQSEQHPEAVCCGSEPTFLGEGQGFVVEAGRCIDLRAIEQAGDLFGGAATAVAAGSLVKGKDRQVGHGILGEEGGGNTSGEDTAGSDPSSRGVKYYY